MKTRAQEGIVFPISEEKMLVQDPSSFLLFPVLFDVGAIVSHRSCSMVNLKVRGTSQVKSSGFPLVAEYAVSDGVDRLSEGGPSVETSFQEVERNETSLLLCSYSGPSDSLSSY